jgi:hypothetical protein
MRSKTVATCLMDLINIFDHIFHIYIIQFFLIYIYITDIYMYMYIYM